MNIMLRGCAGLFAAVVISSTLATEVAVGGCCAYCGCEGKVYRVCRPVCTTRLVEVPCWDTACEEICLPSGAKTSCDNVKIRANQKLMRKTVLKEVPVVVWVVEYVCGNCRSGTGTSLGTNDGCGP